MRSRWQDWMNLLLALWLIVSPFLLAYAGGWGGVAAWNSYIVGAALIVVTVIALSKPRVWQAWGVLVIGIWLIISPFALSFYGPGLARWNNILAGIVIALAGAAGIRTGRGRPSAA